MVTTLKATHLWGTTGTNPGYLQIASFVPKHVLARVRRQGMYVYRHGCLQSRAGEKKKKTEST